jgi:uncharacterized protein YndB with AHSA1/START domain
MTGDTVSATTTISASAEAVFAVLADPARHAAIDGTGRVRDDLDGQRLEPRRSSFFRSACPPRNSMSGTLYPIEKVEGSAH